MDGRPPRSPGCFSTLDAGQGEGSQQHAAQPVAHRLVVRGAHVQIREALQPAQRRAQHSLLGQREAAQRATQVLVYSTVSGLSKPGD